MKMRLECRADVDIDDRTCDVSVVNDWFDFPAFDDIPESNSAWIDSTALTVLPTDNPHLVTFRQLSAVGVLFSLTPRTTERNIHFNITAHLQSTETDNEAQANNKRDSTQDSAATDTTSASATASASTSSSSSFALSYNMRIVLGKAL